MQITLDPKQMEFLRRQAEATERLASEVSKLRKAALETQEALSEVLAALKANAAA